MQFICKMINDISELKIGVFVKLFWKCFLYWSVSISKSTISFLTQSPVASPASKQFKFDQFWVWLNSTVFNTNLILFLLYHHSNWSKVNTDKLTLLNEMAILEIKDQHIFHMNFGNLIRVICYCFISIDVA